MGCGAAKLILDTNALSAAADGDPNLLALLSGAQDIAIPVIVLGEYRFGIAQSRRQPHYRLWLENFAAGCTVLDVDQQTSGHYASLAMELKRAGKPIPSNDLWIAALCRQYRIPLISRDRHFDSVSGIERLEW